MLSINSFFLNISTSIYSLKDVIEINAIMNIKSHNSEKVFEQKWQFSIMPVFNFS